MDVALGSAGIFRTTFFLYAPQAVNPLVSTALILLIAQTQGAQGIAHYSLALSFLYIGEAMATLGLTVPIMRSVALQRARAAACLNAAAIMGLLAGSAIIVGARTLLGWLGYSEPLHTIIAVSLWGVLPSVVIAICNAIFVPLEKAHCVAAFAVGENAIKVMGASILLLSGYGILAICVLIVVLRTLTCCGELFLLRSTLGQLASRLDKQVLNGFLSVIPVFTTSTVVGVMVLRGDVILLSKLTTMTDVGLYFAGARIVFLALPLGTAFAQALLPSMSQHSAASKRSFEQLSHQSVRHAGIVGIAAAFALCVFAAPIISLLYGSQFNSSVGILTIMSFGLLPGFLSTVYGSMFFATHNEAFDLIAKLAKLTVLFGLIALLCPHLGGVGAAIAWVCAQIGHFAAQRIFLAARKLSSHVIRALWRPGCAMLGGLSVFAACKWCDYPLGRVGSLAIFLILLTALRTFSDPEKQALRALRRNLFLWTRCFSRQPRGL